ncbi:hypothetical protein pb186bvf_011895 [Paramecium bursaria]
MQITPQIVKQPQHQAIKNAKYEIQKLEEFDQYIHTGAISNNLKYIVSGGDNQIVKIWKYNTIRLFKQINISDRICVCKFTDDSQLLYVGVSKRIYQFSVNNQFKKLCKYDLHRGDISNIKCITNTIILTSSQRYIIKTDMNTKQQLLKIDEFYYFSGIDYNQIRNIIAIGSHKSINLWNGNDGSLTVQKLNAHNNDQAIYCVLLLNNEIKNQIISLDIGHNLIIWNINYQIKQLEYLQLIENYGYNISLVLQQYIITTGKKFIKVYTINGEFIRQFDHQINDFCQYNNTVQPDSMKAILIQGRYKLQLYDHFFLSINSSFQNPFQFNFCLCKKIKQQNQFLPLNQMIRGSVPEPNEKSIKDLLEQLLITSMYFNQYYFNQQQ